MQNVSPVAMVMRVESILATPNTLLGGHVAQLLQSAVAAGLNPVLKCMKML